MSYSIEDIIDDFMRRVGKKREKDGFARNTARILKKLIARHQIAGQIQQIKALVFETSERRQRYNFDISRSGDLAVDPRVATLYKNAASLVGVEGPTYELVNWLKDEETRLKVVSVVGFGGLGKTTLANEVHRWLKGEFGCSALVPVSQKPDIPKLIRSLLSELGTGLSFHDCEVTVLLNKLREYLQNKRYCEVTVLLNKLREYLQNKRYCEVTVLLNKLREYLQNKRYLVIIDDLWDVSAWDIIKCAFPENGLGSRVIATTRIQDVAKACCSNRRDSILKMKPLSIEDSRRLFFGRIFDSEEACPRQLRDVSVEILKKCDGLPLAIISISSMLASEGSNQQERWENVRNSLGSGTNLTLEGMRQILNLSYKNLPPHLKTCLLYLGMCPEDYTIKRTDLEHQWIAEGFVSKGNEHDVEKAARNYFNELVNRSLIQPVNFDEQGSVTACKVHDMMLDLILLKSAEENFLSIVDDPQAITELDYKVRRLSLHLNGASDGTIFPGNISLSQVRSVMIFGSSYRMPMPPLSGFKFLRVLYAELGTFEVSLPGLCKLYQLRYLKIICPYGCKLPTQIRGLRHLETLDIWGCRKVPSGIVHLRCLLFLNIGVEWPGSLECHQWSDGIGNMKSLRYLNRFNLDKNSLDNIEGLGKLTNLRDVTVTCDNFFPVDKERRLDALCSSLGKICSLEYLFLDTCGCIDGLMAMSPPRRLERLDVSPSMGASATFFSRVPQWMGELCNLNVLKLRVCVLLKDGVGILAELPKLTHLDLQIKASVKETIVIYGRAFPVLKRFNLQLSNSSYLTFQAGAMPMLQSLKLTFYAKGSDQNRPGPVGIEHLSALEEVYASISRSGATEFETTGVEFTLRSAINMHPRHPRLDIYLNHYLYFIDD